MSEAWTSRWRWAVLALLFASTTLNYLDRAILGVLLPVIRQDIPIDAKTNGWITASFQIAYTIGALGCGWLLDRHGSKIGMALMVAIWSGAAALHAFATAPLQFGAWRAVLGLAEAGNFPAAAKAAGEWFAPKERAFAIGVFNAGTTAASVLGPPALIALQKSIGWQACFVLVGALGALWLVAWWRWFWTPAQPTTPGLVPAAPPLGRILRRREAWGYGIAKFFTDPAWWFLLFWLPLYFKDVRQLPLEQVGWALSAVYLMAGLGAVSGGWASGRLMGAGWPRGRARKTVMLGCVLLMPAAGFGAIVEEPLAAIALVSVAAFGHQAWATNLFTTATDVFPGNEVGRVGGFGGMMGGGAGVIFSALVPGYLVGRFGYQPLFVGMAAFYLVAWLAVDRLMGNLEPRAT
ncbi:MAG: MFS transporter [Gemmatimonadetes bacterium]|nr:MFS transporter [Gemmatimonadota bacterium]